MAKLTIITPTYNRAHTIGRCYESLLRQTCRDFEWIIIDDGSTDDTQKILAGFCTELFPIIKLYKDNGGKHTALNAAHPHISGDYVLILDSDDYLMDTAVEEVLSAWKRYRENEAIGVVTFLKGSCKNDPNCTVKDFGRPVDILRYKRVTIQSSDCCEVIRTELFLEFPFPVFEGEKFVSECALWNRVGQRYKCVYINSVIYICEYLKGGLTESGRSMRIRNPMGGMFTSDLRMDKRNYFDQRIKYGLLYTCYGFFAKMGVSQQLKQTDHPFITAICMPLGFGLYLLWKHKY